MRLSGNDCVCLLITLSCIAFYIVALFEIRSFFEWLI